MTKRAKAPILAVDLGDNGGHVELFNVEEVRDWVNKEIGFWKWIHSGRPRDMQELRIRNEYNQKHTHLRQLLSNVDGSVETNTFASYLSLLEEGLKTLYGNQEILHSTHADAVFVEGTALQRGRPCCWCRPEFHS